MIGIIDIGWGCAGLMAGILLGGFCMYRYQLKHKNVYDKKVSHDQRYLAVMNQWFILKQTQMQIADGLKHKKIKHIAIYGMGIYGRHLIRELAGSDITVDYGIDQKAVNPYRGIPVKSPGDKLEQVDAIVNTVVWAQSEIERKLSINCDCEVLSLEELIFERFQLERNDQKNEWEEKDRF